MNLTTNFAPTSNIEQAMQHIQSLPISEQKSIFDYIDFVVLKHQRKNQNSTDEKCQFGLYQGKGSFKLADDCE